MPQNFSPLWEWINERYAIMLRKRFVEDERETPPTSLYEWDCATGYDEVTQWEMRAGKLTLDPILSQFRFCNVRREDDRVTVWVRNNIREPFADHPNLWFMLAIARTINWPDTLRVLISSGNLAWPYDDHFDPRIMGEVMDGLKAVGKKVYTGAYMIRAESNKNAPWYSWTKQQYVAQIVLGRLWEDREYWAYQLHSDSLQRPKLEEVWTALSSNPRYIGWGPFMSFQTVLEWRHTRYLRDAPDATSWAAIGPGSMRGLNRLHGRPVLKKLSQEQALEEMRWLFSESVLHLAPHVPRLEMEDIQNSLCETDKYLRVKNSNGRERPRALYVPGRGW